MTSSPKAPLARTEDLVVQQANDETLVYDKKHHHAHCLSKLAALVWRHCDGKRSSADLAEVLNAQLAVPRDSQLVELALQELAQANLLAESTPVSAEQKQYTRREATHRLGVGAAAAFLLAPLITSIMTQTAMAQASPAKKNSGTTVAPGATTTAGTGPTTTAATPTTTSGTS